jgi:hypothetical protein
VVTLEALRRIVPEPSVDLAVDGNAVVVVEHDQLAQPERSGHGARFVRNTLHHAAVAREHVRVVINDVESGLVELRGEHLLREGHTYGGGKTLTQRARGRFDPHLELVFGVTRAA